MRGLTFAMVFCLAVILGSSSQADDQGFRIKSFAVADNSATLWIETIGVKIALTGTVDEDFQLASADRRVLAICDHIGSDLACEVRYDGSNDGLLALFSSKDEKSYRLANHTVRSSGERSIDDLMDQLHKLNLSASETFRRLDEAVAVSDTIEQVINHLKSPNSPYSKLAQTEPQPGAQEADGRIKGTPSPYDGPPEGGCAGGGQVSGEYRFTAGGCRNGGPILGPPIVLVPPPPRPRPPLRNPCGDDETKCVPIEPAGPGDADIDHGYANNGDGYLDNGADLNADPRNDQGLDDSDPLVDGADGPPIVADGGGDSYYYNDQGVQVVGPGIGWVWVPELGEWRHRRGFIREGVGVGIRQGPAFGEIRGPIGNRFAQPVGRFAQPVGRFGQPVGRFGQPVGRFAPGPGRVAFAPGGAGGLRGGALPAFRPPMGGAGIHQPFRR